MTDGERTLEGVSRRGVLKGAATAAGTAALANTATADYRGILDETVPAVQNQGGGRTFLLLGIVGGWLGIGPAEIDGASGPTLRMMEGEEHRIVWINGDGAHHNFTIADQEGSIVEATELMNEQGGFQEITITADPEMAEYYCAPHPVQMRGPIELIEPEDVHELQVQVEDGDGNPLEAEVFLDDMHSFSDFAGRPEPPEGKTDDEESGETDEESSETDEESDEDSGEHDETDEETGEDDDHDAEETPTEELALARFDMLEDGDYSVEAWTFGHERTTQEVSIDGSDEELTLTLPKIEPGEPAETFELTLEEDEWRGEAPEEIEGETNPTLELEAEETYAVEWENGIGRRHDEGEMEPGEKLPGHNFVIAEGGDVDQWNTHVRSAFTDEEGETQTVEFLAKEEMEVYLDQSQLEAHGKVEVE